VNSTSGGGVGLDEMILLTLPTLHTGDTDEVAVSAARVTFVNSAFVRVGFLTEAQLPEHCVQGETRRADTQPGRCRDATGRVAQRKLMAGCLFLVGVVSAGLGQGRWRGLLRQWNRRQRCRLASARAPGPRTARSPASGTGFTAARRPARRRRRQARPKRGCRPGAYIGAP